MPGVLVMADDFTGANDTGVLLKTKGLNAISFLRSDDVKNFHSDEDVFCINTDTRDKEKQYSYNLIKSITHEFKDQVKVISKRIDSTLRGNAGSEIDGVLDELGKEYKAVVVASYPSSGRICIGGYVLVNGVPLEKTNVSKDIKTPVKSSNVIDIIKSQSSKSVGHIYLEKVLKGSNFLSREIQDNSNEIIVIDAVTDEDIKIIADACVLSQQKIVCIDPGPFTAYFSLNLLKSGKEDFYRSLMVIGSTTDLTRRQIEYFKEHKNILIYNVDVSNLIDDFEYELQEALSYFKQNYKKYKYLCISTSLEKDEIRDKASMSISYIISDRLNKLAKNILNVKDFNINLAYLTGGDISQGFLKNINSIGVEIIDEIIPLAVYGKAVGGEFDGLNIITKGGLIGNETSADFILSAVEKNVKGGSKNE